MNLQGNFCLRGMISGGYHDDSSHLDTRVKQKCIGGFEPEFRSHTGMGLVIESSRFNSLSKNLLESFDALRARPELDEGTNGEDLNYLRNFRSC